MKRTTAIAAAIALCLTAAGARAAVRIETSPARPAPGEAFWVQVLGKTGAGPLEVRFGGHTFALWRGASGWEGLAAVDRDEAPGTKELLVVDRSPETGAAPVAAEVRVEERHYAEQHLKVNERMVTLSPEDQARAAREGREIREALAGRTASQRWEVPFRVPLEGRVSSGFGVRRFYNGKPKGYHGGLDLAAPRGTPVHASAAGTVALVGDYFYTGHTVFLDHGYGFFTAYFHMDSVDVVAGQAVDAGDRLGRVGSTGRSTGPHLHWAAYLAGVRVDPQSLVALLGGGVGGGETP